MILGRLAFSSDGLASFGVVESPGLRFCWVLPLSDEKGWLGTVSKSCRLISSGGGVGPGLP